MGISKEQLASIIGGKARELCSPESDDKINEARRINQMEGYYDEKPSNYDYDADYYDSLYLSESSIQPRGKKHKYTGDIQYSEAGAANSMMDDKIKKSMLEHPIDRSALDPNSRSVLDELNVQPRQQQRRQITEQQQNNYGNSSVDYSIIKAIVNECLNEYFSKMPLNESNTLSTIGLKEGVIKVVDNKGNVFKAKLQKIGNKNENQ